MRIRKQWTLAVSAAAVIAVTATPAVAAPGKPPGGPKTSGSTSTTTTTSGPTATTGTTSTTATTDTTSTTATTGTTSTTATTGTTSTTATRRTAGGFGSSWGDVTAEQEQQAIGADGNWDPALDLGSLYSLARRAGLPSLWRSGIDGSGITVALIDTGIAPVTGLDAPGKIVNGPDLSFDSQSPGARYVDGFGHGTHMAGIIAGRDAAWDPRNVRPADFAGVAPGAQLLNMKVGAADGGVDVSQVIAAINWVAEHRTAGGMNVRVIALPYGTESAQPWELDPLARAVEDAARAGIVVVTAAGNAGLDTSRLLMPALDPNIIAVGAVDRNSTKVDNDDTVAAFTSGGSAERRPDVVAPGRSVASLRAPGSYIDVMSPGGRIAEEPAGRMFRGSGTSQATAFVAGEVALLLQARPGLNPAEVKAALVGSAKQLAVSHPAMGAGEVDVVAATSYQVPSGVGGTSETALGIGSLHLSRGGAHVVDPISGVALTGEQDIFGQAWDGAAWARESKRGDTWDAGWWNDRRWTGSGFSSVGWQSVTWPGETWGGVLWSSHETGARWTPDGWTNQSWEGRSWRAGSWEGRSWRSLF